MALLMKLGKHSLWIDRLQNLLHNHEFMLGSSVAEQVTVNHLVAGSNPARAAIIFEVKFLFTLGV